MSLPSLNALRVFEAAARQLSFKKAAKELFISPPAVSHQIRTLEKQLGVTLFERLNRALKLTPQGHSYFLQVKKGLHILQIATADLLSSQSQKNFSISCIPFLTNALLIPNIQLFKEQYPNKNVHIFSQTKLADLTLGDIDVAIRHQKGEEDGLHYEWLSKIHITPLCSEAYWESIPQNQQANLSIHNMINMSVDTHSWPHWLKQFGYETAPKETITLDNYQAVIESVKQGLGLAMGFKPVINTNLAHEKIITPFGKHVCDYGDLYLVYTLDNAKNPEIVAFQNWLKSLIARLESDE
jgi:LysR family glycine cleavage system transcriptional activator